MAGQRKPSTASPPLSVGAWLRESRQRQNLAIKDIAARIATDQSHLGKYERDQRPVPLWMAEDLAKAYGVPLAELKQRILARQMFDACEGDADLVLGAAGRLAEEFAPYLVNKPANNLSAPPPSDPPRGAV